MSKVLRRGRVSTLRFLIGLVLFVLFAPDVGVASAGDEMYAAVSIVHARSALLGISTSALGILVWSMANSWKVGWRSVVVILSVAFAGLWLRGAIPPQEGLPDPGMWATVSGFGFGVTLVYICLIFLIELQKLVRRA